VIRCTDRFIVRATSPIRADGTPAAPAPRQLFKVSTSVAARPLRALRANRVFHTDKKHIRMKNTVLDKTDDGTGI
jgi:hypothetical protein